jgi:hypothetical protein
LSREVTQSPPFLSPQSAFRSPLFFSLRLQVIEPLIAGGYVVLLLVAAQLETKEGWIATLIGIAGLAFLAWVLSLRRSLAISDTPTSRIESAAQGYVELVGRALNNPDEPVLSKLTGLPCVWCRCSIYRRTANNKWEHVSTDVSTGTFLLDDGSGRCLVDPERAEVIPKKKETWIRDGYRYDEWLILPQERVYAIGEFSTVGGANSELNFNRDLSSLLSEWKQKKAWLLERYDLDKDGTIGEREWMLARQQAKREVSKRHQKILSQAGTNVLHKPTDGRLFLISNIDADKLASRYRMWVFLHLSAFVAATISAWWLATNW